MPLWAILALAGGGLGLMKGTEDQKQAEAKRMVDLATARTSGYTGRHPAFTEMPGLVGPMTTGAFQGAMMGKDFAGDMPKTVDAPITEAGFTKPELASGQVRKPSIYHLGSPGVSEHENALGSAFKLKPPPSATGRNWLNLNYDRESGF